MPTYPILDNHGTQRPAPRFHNRPIQAALAAVAISMAAAGTARASVTVLYSFQGSSDGANPYGSLIESGGNLYGMTSAGGTGSGTIFSVPNTGGSDTILHAFTSGSDGANPQGSLILSGGTLYGMTFYGGSNNQGVVFSLPVTGGSDTILNTFTSGSDGANPQGSLIKSGNTLYGMTFYGGSNNHGAAFSMLITPSLPTLLLTFASGSYGINPAGSFIQAGTTLYGMASSGVANNDGAVFSEPAGGGAPTVLHTFAGGSADGAHPFGSLLLSGSTLYGVTSDGGSSNEGVIFSMPVTGGTVTILHSFASGTDGNQPRGSLIEGSNGTLYGMTAVGGANNDGTIFSINANGSGYQVLDSFNGADGAQPYGDLLLLGSTLYGMTNSGGANGVGEVFSTNASTPEPASLAMMSIAGLGILLLLRKKASRA